ncbi:MAG: type II secretion system minor pseudopilin GspJ [Dokdonella sp.]
MKSRRGFTLIELLVALVVFAALAAAAYGGLSAIARTRSALAAQQDRFAAITRAVSLLERDLRQGVARTVLGNTSSQPLPALIGSADGIEFTRLGYANPLAEPRSNLERVVYALDGGNLQRGRYLVLDRAPNSVPVTTKLLDGIEQLRLRYFGTDRVWRDAWPPSSTTPTPEVLPLAVEFRFVLTDLGEIRRLVELPSTPWPCAVGTTSTGAAPSTICQ